MAKFDTSLFLEMSGQGQGPVQSIGTAFGMPSCLVNLGAAALSLLPTSVLNSIRGSSSNGAARADDVIKASLAKLRFLTGIIEYDTEDGTLRFVSDSSKDGKDRDEGGILNDIGSFVGALGAAAGFAGRLYNNYQTTVAEINSIKDCIENYNNFLKYSGGAAGDERMRLAGISPERYKELVDQSFGIEKEELNDALQFKLKALELKKRIEDEMARRLSNPELEPEFTLDYSDIISGSNLRIAPTIPSNEVKEVFRLSYGPPVSKEGKFILSVDGLYFDSQTSGIVPALLEIESRKNKIQRDSKWKLDYDPNLGGRGKQLTLDDLKYYINTILDPNILDESSNLTDYYDADIFLADLIGQKNRRIFDLSGQIVELQDNNSSQILISNLRQVMLSETAHYLDKINRRKKQIELAVKLPVIYGKGSLYTIGEVPINDFSYLEGINFVMDFSKQRSLVLSQTDVSGVVLPLEVNYVKQIDTDQGIVLEHLLVNTLGQGNIISDTSGPVLSVNNSITTDGLLAFYNFLQSEVSDPSSTEYKLLNSADTGMILNAQLVGNESNIYDRGIGIAYLKGITSHNPNNPTVPSGIGSYIKLPPVSELQDLVYSQNGATIDLWCHIPELDGEYYGFNDQYTVSGLYRLILTNENTGLQDGVNPQSNIQRLQKDSSNNVTRGLIFGFSRDRRLTLGLDASNKNDDNKIEDACLVLAPTQSYDSSSVGFIRRNNSSNCDAGNGWLSMKFNIWDTVEGVSLSSCGRTFNHIALTLNPQDNEISFYCDGVLLTTSSYESVFGVNPAQSMPDIPALKKNNSFQYGLSGPQLDSFFTPWIVGGGYTDGMQTGNFMGGSFGGIISGLKGYIGSLKFYNRALDQGEILNNFNSNKDFFKNIDVPNLMWEPIVSE